MKISPSIDYKSVGVTEFVIIVAPLLVYLNGIFEFCVKKENKWKEFTRFITEGVDVSQVRQKGTYFCKYAAISTLVTRFDRSSSRGQSYGRPFC